MENRHKKNKAPTEVDALFSCGGPTRTGDLQVMSLASYQLLHSAIISIGVSSRLRCKGRNFFFRLQVFRQKKWQKNAYRPISQTIHCKKRTETMYFRRKRSSGNSKKFRKAEQTRAVRPLDQDQMLSNRVVEQLLLHGFDIGKGANTKRRRIGDDL